MSSKSKTQTNSNKNLLTIFLKKNMMLKKLKMNLKIYYMIKILH